MAESPSRSAESQISRTEHDTQSKDSYQQTHTALVLAASCGRGSRKAARAASPVPASAVQQQPHLPSPERLSQLHPTSLLKLRLWQRPTLRALRLLLPGCAERPDA